MILYLDFLNKMDPVIDNEYRFTDIALLHRIKHHSIEMMRDRGNTPSDENKKILRMSTKEFDQYYDQKAKKENTSFIYAMRTVFSDEQEDVYMNFLETPKDVGVDLIKELINKAYEDKVNHLIIITKHKLGADAKKWIFKLRISLRIEVFLFGEIAKNPTKHFLVPKHEKASLEEQEEVKQKLSGYNIPEMSVEDPIAKWLGFLPGDLIRIYRVNLGTPMLVNRILSYRVVVDKPLRIKGAETTKESKTVRSKK